MGKNLLKFPTVRDMFKAASHMLKFDLLKLCTEGPKDKLDRTEYAQLAIFVCSLAALERLREERPSAIENCVATAGFSLGEITALVFAEVFTFERGIVYKVFFFFFFFNNESKSRRSHRNNGDGTC
jgi:[acyl-carrier-protein] S-malonyltransferase